MPAGKYQLADTTRRTLSVCAVGLLLICTANTARGAITLDLSPVDTLGALPGHVSYDLNVTSETDWTAAAGLLELSSGSIYQHALGGDTGPTHAPLNVEAPGLAFDTHVIGNIAGGAGDLDGAGFAFDEQRLDVSWFNTSTDNIGTTMIGRLTLTEDAAGTMAIMLTSAKDSARYDISLEPGALPALNQIIEEVQVQPDPWTQPELPILPRRDDWADFWGAQYGNNLWTNDYLIAPSDYLPFTAPTAGDERVSYDYNLLLPTRHAVSTWDARRTGLYERLHTLKPTFIVTSRQQETNSLPEPGTAVLCIMGGCALGAVTGRRW